MKLINLTGTRFGRLIVVKRGPNYPHPTKKIPQWVCHCDCGKDRIINGCNLRRGLVKSCGCLRKEITIARTLTHGCSGKRGKRATEYETWAGMRQRCFNENNSDYRNYGGRGITICERWDSFENFLADMGRKPSKRHTIERTNNELGYTPENCVWAIHLTQANNTRSNRFFVYKSRRMTIRQILLETGSKVKYTTLKARLIHQGLSVEDAIRR